MFTIPSFFNDNQSLSDAQALGLTARGNGEGAHRPSSSGVDTTRDLAKILNIANSGCSRDLEQWLINHVMLNWHANRIRDSDISACLRSRSMGYLYTFSSSDDLATDLGWSVSPINHRENAYHRCGQAPLSIATNIEIGRRTGTIDWEAIAVSSPGVVEAIRRNFNGFKFDDVEPPRNGWESIDDPAPVFCDILSGAGIPDFSGGVPLNEMEPSVKEIETRLRRGDSAPGDMAPVASRDAALDSGPKEVVFGGVATIGGQPTLLYKAGRGNGARVLRSVVHSGYAAAPMQLFENLRTLDFGTGFDRALISDKGASRFLQNFDHGIDIDPWINGCPINGFSEFLADPVVHSFRDRTESIAYRTGEFLPCATVLARIALASLQGLARHEDAFARTFDGAERKSVFRYLCARILSHLGRAGEEVANVNAFIDSMRLVHEEVSTLLALAKPYRLHDLDLNLPSVGDVRPVYGIRNSGLNAFSAILSGVEATGGERGKIRVAIQRHSYYEEQFAIDEAVRYRVVPPIGNDELTESMDRIRSALASGERLDLFVGAFHDNLACVINEYHEEHLLDQVRAIYASGLASGKFTVAIDATIGRTDEPQIRQFLEEFSDRIASGQLNIVLFRSAQKFDMAGMDHHNGAFFAVYNDGTSWRSFNACMMNRRPQANTNFQGLCHLQKVAQDELNLYRDQIAARHGRLLAILPASMVQASSDTESVLVAPNSDRNACFLDLHLSRNLLRVGGDAAQVAGCFKAFMKELGVVVVNRPSFGFPTTVLGEVDATKQRITLGLEDEASLMLIRDALVALNDVGNTAVVAGDSAMTRARFLDLRWVRDFHRVRQVARASGRVASGTAFENSALPMPARAGARQSP